MESFREFKSFGSIFSSDCMTRKIVKGETPPTKDYSCLKSQEVRSGATEMALESDRASSFPFSDTGGRQRLCG